MEGWKLKEGELLDNSKANLLSIVSRAIFSQKYKNASYKFCFLKCILDEIFDTDNEYELNISKLSENFSITYWNLVNVHSIPSKYGSTKGASTSYEVEIYKMLKEKPYLKGIAFESIKNEDQKEYINCTKGFFIRYVIGAFYSDLNGLLYGFSKSKNIIYFNKKSYDFLCNNKTLLEELNYYEWLKFTEKILVQRGESINNLSTLLEESNKRTDLSYFKDKLIEVGCEETCFYCGKKLEKDITLDHVIPWDFNKTDELWNLVFCCRTCNSSKNDRVPTKEFIDKLIKRNKELNIESPDLYKVYDVAVQNGVEVWKK